jgi:hypothetical protein
MLEDDALGTRVTHALNHGSMVHGIGEVDTTRELGTECGQGGVVGHVAG